MAPFVGRLDELEILDRALHQAIDGVPRIVLVGGDAGVGKTRLADELLGRAARLGATVLAGACHEDLAVPYLPIAGALRPLASGPIDPSDRSAIARLLDPGSAPTSEPDPASGDRDRLALFLAVDRALLAAARSGPVALAVDDLHWADDASLDLLAHLLTTVSHEATFDGLPLLVVATHRPAEPGTRVARSIERFQREPGAVSLTLSGLGELEVNELVAALAPARPSRRLLHEIVEATDGNPLLVEGVVAGLLREGAHVDNDELMPGPVGLATGGASLLDAEIRARLDELSERCRELLTVAAFLGDGGTVAELTSAIAADGTDGIADDLDEAVEARLLEDDGQHYRFAHPQVRQVLYHGPRPRQRAALHLRIADALESLYGERAEAHALPIAHHLSRAGTSAASDRLVHWNRLAGDQAWAMTAWAQAGRCYDIAVSSLGLPGPDRWEEVADLHLAAGWADFHNFDLTSATGHLRGVVDLARGHDDMARWGEALQPLIRIQIGHAASDVATLVAEAEEFLAAAGDRRPDLRALVLALLAEAQFRGADLDAGRAYVEAARLTLLDVEDAWVSSLVEFAAGLVALAGLDLVEARRAFAESDRQAERSEDVWRQRTALGRLPVISWMSGDVPAAVEEAAAARAHNERWNLRGELTLSAAVQAGVGVAQARFADVERAGAEAALLYRRTGYVWAPPIALPALAAARAARGDRDGALEAVDLLDEVGGRGTQRYRQLIECWSGDVETVRAMVEARPWPPPPTMPNILSADAATVRVEVAAAIGDRAMAAASRPALERLFAGGVVWTTGWPLLVPRLLGVVASMDGDLGDAIRWFETARAQAALSDAPGERARIDLDHAGALLASPTPDLVAAHELLERAAAEFDRLGMLPFLVRARVLDGHRQDAGATRAGQMRVILYTDIVDSTELNVRAGDQAYLALLREHNRIVRDRLRRHDGVEFKHTGDGVCAWFVSATAAVECALAIRDDLDRFSAVHPELPLRVRIGLAAGEPLDDEGDLFGLTVVAAGRICGAAGAGRVFVADEIPPLVRGGAVRFSEVGEVALKGFPAPFRLHEALTHG